MKYYPRIRRGETLVSPLFFARSGAGSCQRPSFRRSLSIWALSRSSAAMPWRSIIVIHPNLRQPLGEMFPLRALCTVRLPAVLFHNVDAFSALPPLQALPVPPVDGGISPQRLPGAAGQSPGRAPPWPPAPPPPSPAARRPHPGGSSGSWAPPAAPAGILPHSATAPQAARPPESVRIIGQIMRYHERRKRVDCKSEGNILGVKKWL